jgi:hypothetical protein
VEYEKLFYIGRVIALSEQNGTATMKYLHAIPGSDPFNWQRRDDTETVVAERIFFGPIEFASVTPFTIANIICFKKAHNELYKRLYTKTKSIT